MMTKGEDLLLQNIALLLAHEYPLGGIFEVTLCAAVPTLQCICYSPYGYKLFLEMETAHTVIFLDPAIQGFPSGYGLPCGDFFQNSHMVTNSIEMG